MAGVSAAATVGGALVTAAPRGVAAKTLRTGLPGCRERTWMSSRTVESASLGIIATPTLVRKWPEPVRRVVGDLSQSDRVIDTLQLPPIAPMPPSKGSDVRAT